MAIQKIIASLRINKFTITPTGSRCEMWPGFSVNCRISHFWAVFSAFPGPGGTSYRPGRKSVLNRIFEKINFLCKNIGKTFGN